MAFKLPFIKNKVTLTQVPVSQKIRDSHVAQSIFNYLNMQTNGALLLTGDWGSGKTYYIKNVVFPLIAEEKDFYIPIMISLYGVTDKNSLVEKVFLASMDKKVGANTIFTESLKHLKTITDASPYLKRFVDIERLIAGGSEGIFDFLSLKKLLICFDDIERMSDKFKINDFLGVVNDLVENKKCKILLIANEDKIQDKSTMFKEKTIEKTIYFSPEISVVFDNIISDYDGSFKKYLSDNKDFILSVRIPKIENKKESTELKKEFSNIRILKFAIEHFKYVFLLLSENKNIEDELLQKQLRSIWFFTSAISNEFKKPNNITYEDRKDLDKAYASFDLLGLQNFYLEENSIPSKDSDRNLSYPEIFKNYYYNCHNEKYIFFPQIYNLITAGQNIKLGDFITDLEESFNIVQGKINPPYDLLNKFTREGYWNFSNEEIKEKLEQLLNFVDSGSFNDIVSYFNAGVYLFNLSALFDSTNEEIKDKIINGLNTFFVNPKINNYLFNEFDLVSGHFVGENFNQLRRFTQEKIISKKEELKNMRSAQLEHLFKSDIESFTKEFLPDNFGQIKMINEPILYKFNLSEIKDIIFTWSPKDIIEFSTFIRRKYVNTSFRVELREDLEFFMALEKEIIENAIGSKTLSNHLLVTQLLPIVEECKKELQK